MPAEVFRTVQKRVWNRTVQKCSTGTLVTSFHFDTVFVGAAGAHAAGPRCHTMARRRPASRPGDGRNQIQLSNQQNNKHAHDLPPLTESLHTYSCARVPRTWQRIMAGRAHGTNDQREVTLPEHFDILVSAGETNGPVALLSVAFYCLVYCSHCPPTPWGLL